MPQLREQNLALKRALRQLHGRTGRLLEAGCGQGRFLRAIQQHWQGIGIHGCDLDSHAIALAKTLDQRITYSLGSLTSLPYADASFDVVLVFDVLEHLKEPEKGLAEISRVMTPGALFHALVPCEGQPLTLHWLLWRINLAANLKEKHGGHIQRFHHQRLRALFHANGLVITGITYSMHPIGQIKDTLTYLGMEKWFLRWHLFNSLFRLTINLLWPAAYIESSFLSRFPISAVVTHVTAQKGIE